MILAEPVRTEILAEPVRTESDPAARGGTAVAGA